MAPRQVARYHCDTGWDVTGTTQLDGSVGARYVMFTMNPYAPPTADEGISVSRATMDAAQRAEIQSKLKKLNGLSFALGIPGLILQGIGQSRDLPLLILLGMAVFVAGMVFYAKMRGRHGAWGVLGLASCLGMLVLYFLPKHCVNCSAGHSYTTKECDRCGAPLGS